MFHSHVDETNGIAAFNRDPNYRSVKVIWSQHYLFLECTEYLTRICITTVDIHFLHR